MGEEDACGRVPGEDPSCSDSSSTLEVLQVLHGLQRGIRVDPAFALDADHVADVLLDHGDALPPSELLYLLSTLQVERLQHLAEEICNREYLFLNVAGLADEAVVHLYVQYASGRREAPFRSWAERVVADVVRRAVTDPELAPFKPALADPGERFVMSVMGHTINQMGREARRLIWLSWVELRSIPEIVRETGVHLERVEWILSGVIEESKRVVQNLFRGPRPGGREKRRKDRDEDTA